MEFHSIGVPQGAFGPHPRHRDIGRGQVTQKRKDLYKFRTPPLTSVELTAPYGHNGVFDSLEEVVIHHFNPVAFYVQEQEYLTLDKFEINKLLGSRDKVLQAIDLYDNTQIDNLIAFLRTH